MTHRDLTIIITTFKSEDKIEKCLNSIDNRVKVILVENSNENNFKEKIEKKFLNVSCILSGGNLGYGKANNIGLKKTKTKFALILNPDTILDSNSLSHFFDFVKTNKDFAIAGPNQDEQIKNLDNSNFNELKPFEVKSIKGYAMFLNVEKFKDVGFFDENYFLYLEEIDLCKRIKDANKKIIVCPKINIFHYGGGSVNKKYINQIELTRNWHWMWSLFYFNKKHFGFTKALILITPKLFNAIFKILIYFILLNKKKREIYLKRMSGILNSIYGKSSWYRPTFD